MNHENPAARAVEDFSDRRVFIYLERSGMLDAVFGGLQYGQSPSGPTRAYISPGVGDDALVRFANRHGLAAHVVLAFRDEARPGESVLLEPVEAVVA